MKDEDMMPNGGWIGLARRMGEKHGPMAVMLLAACAALYLCVVMPFQAQQKLLTDSNKMLLENTIEQSQNLTIEVERQNTTQNKQTEILESIDGQMKQATEIMAPVPRQRQQILDNSQKELELLTSINECMKDNSQDHEKLKDGQKQIIDKLEKE